MKDFLNLYGVIPYLDKTFYYTLADPEYGECHPNGMTSCPIALLKSDGTPRKKFCDYQKLATGSYVAPCPVP